MEKILVIAALAMVTVGAFTDFRSSRIPNWLTYTGCALAIGLRAWMGFPSIIEGVTGALLAAAVMCILFFVGGMGGGDVKMMIAVGAWVGFSHVQGVMVAAAICGGLLALIYILGTNKGRKVFANLIALLQHHFSKGLQPHPTINIRGADGIRVPFGIAIAMGAWYWLGPGLWVR